MKIEIKARWSNDVKFEGEFSSRRECILEAIKTGIDLSGCDLRDCDLSGIDLRGCDLRDCDLSGSNLRDSDLRDCDLRGSNLSGSNLRDSDLSDSNLSGSDLRGSNLRGSNLRGSNLSGSNLSGSDLRDSNLRDSDLSDSDLSDSNLSGSNLRGSDLSKARADFLAEVLRLPNELEFLRAAIIDGKVDGSTYSGECACLAGTLAHAKGIENYKGEEIRNGLAFRADSTSPRERLFMAIKEGDNPETNPVSKIVLEWTEEAMAIRDNIRGPTTPASK